MRIVVVQRAAASGLMRYALPRLCARYLKADS
jgi:hypothetical protein